MSKEQPPSLDTQLQVLDVSVVDALSHLEALLRHCHSIQRGLLDLRREGPPPSPRRTEDTSAELKRHTDEMQREWSMLGEIIRDLAAGIRRLKDEPEIVERRSGHDRRSRTVST